MSTNNNTYGPCYKSIGNLVKFYIVTHVYIV